ncbi:MAG: hypothetical protein R6W71_09565 [Bacteroidales bacterium]
MMNLTPESIFGPSGPWWICSSANKKKTNTTTIVVSHNKAFLEAADTLLLIRDGKIGYSGDPGRRRADTRGFKCLYVQ